MASTMTIAVLDANELKDGEMKQVDFEDGKVLLSKLGDKIHATSAFCTHYGAPLAKGVLVSSGRVTCPWHGACFNVCTGDIEDAPAPASLHSFTASINADDGKIYVTADPSKTTSQQKSRPIRKATVAASVKQGGGVVIVGGGAGAIATVVGLREQGFGGKITILSAEPHAPIDRTKLSKALITDASKIEWYGGPKEVESTFAVDLKTSVRVTSVNTADKTVEVDNGQEIAYDTLVLAPGSTPRRLPIPGADLDNVFVLRSVDDSKKIDAALGEGKSLVVVGSSFISMEIVAAVAKRGLKEIHVIGMEKYPFQAVLGEQVGKGLKEYHESKGVKFHGEAKTTSIDTKSSSDKTASSVTIEYKSGEKAVLSADVIVLGVGVSPTTEFLQGSGIQTRKDGGVEVDEYLKVKGVKDVYAIGDIAVYPEITSGELKRIEHWNVAQNHGRAVATGIAGNPLPFDKVPIFWSAQGQQLRYVGNAIGYDEAYVKGNPAELKFVAYYFKGDKVLAVASMQADPLATKCSELIRLGLMPTASEIKAGKDPLSVDISSLNAHVRR